MTASCGDRFRVWIQKNEHTMTMKNVRIYNGGNKKNDFVAAG